MEPLVQRLVRHLGTQPHLGPGVFVAPGARVIGDVHLGAASSVWFNAVVRGDINRIEVGDCTNIQDNAVLHVADPHPCLVGHRVTIGHCARVHACTVGDEVLMGMGATILDGAVIGAHSIIGANALVPQGMQVPPGSLVLGVPGRGVRPLSESEQAGIRVWADRYAELADYYLRHPGLAV